MAQDAQRSVGSGRLARTYLIHYGDAKRDERQGFIPMSRNINVDCAQIAHGNRPVSDPKSLVPYLEYGHLRASQWYPRR